MGKWTRRGLIGAGLVTGGALVVGVAIRPDLKPGHIAARLTDDDERLLNLWVRISRDNQVTAIVPHSEMGQGVGTSLTMMLADELDADWAKVDFIEAPADYAYANYAMGKGFLLGQTARGVPAPLVGTLDGAIKVIADGMKLMITGGSMSVRTTGEFGMRVAGAAAREMLVNAAADRWGVAAGEITVNAGVVAHSSGKQATFGELIDAAAELSVPRKPTLKTPDQFNIMGTHVPRHDIPGKVDGSAQFGLDADVPGMKYATVRRSPVFGGTVRSIDDSAARSMPGVVDVINLDDAVAVVADGYWQAKQALEAVRVDFDAGAAKVSSESIFEQFDNDISSGEATADVAQGDAGSTIAGAARTFRAEYRVPYLAHACMEPLNATARVANGQCEVWTGTQNPLGCRAEAAAAAGVEEENCQVHQHFLGGGFGRRAQNEVVVQAVRLSRAIGEPVKVIWSREEDTRQDNYRPAIASHFAAALDPSGRPLAWQNRYVDKHEPAEAPLIPYAIEHQDIGHVASPTHVPFGPWRSVDHSQHGFFTESFMDELAREAGADPFEFRRDLLEPGSRQRTVLERAVSESNWGQDLPEGWGRGIALQSSFGSHVAQVVEVEVDRAGAVRVHRVVCAVDPGFAVAPDGLVAQMESGIIYGLTAALYGEINIEEGAVRQSNFHDYPMLRMNEAPIIETHVINSMAATLGGAGEPGTPAIAPALANAIFEATGTRVRNLPVSNYDLRVRIEEREV